MSYAKRFIIQNTLTDSYVCWSPMTGWNYDKDYKKANIFNEKEANNFISNKEHFLKLKQVYS